MGDIVDHMFQNFFASIILKEFGESHHMGFQTYLLNVNLL
jgi:hypothetical protein